MKVELEKTYPMPGSTNAAWGFLQNIEGVAGCMPGAKITERIDATHYKGTISVRVGPAGMSFKGEIEVKELDAATRMLHLVGKGSDTSGTSGASMDLVARIEPGATDGTSNLVGKSEVTMSGKAAAFGGRMMGSVADQILKQFAGNFATQVKARAAATETAAGEASTPADATRAAEVPMGATSAAITAPGGAGASSAHMPDVPAPANELNALALFWAILRDWFRGLFRRKPA
jgi:uncharacterized protein